MCGGGVGEQEGEEEKGGQLNQLHLIVALHLKVHLIVAV